MNEFRDDGPNRIPADIETAIEDLFRGAVIDWDFLKAPPDSSGELAGVYDNNLRKVANGVNDSIYGEHIAQEVATRAAIGGKYSLLVSTGIVRTLESAKPEVDRRSVVPQIIIDVLMRRAIEERDFTLACHALRYTDYSNVDSIIDVMGEVVNEGEFNIMSKVNSLDFKLGESYKYGVEDYEAATDEEKKDFEQYHACNGRVWEIERLYLSGKIKSLKVNNIARSYIDYVRYRLIDADADELLKYVDEGRIYTETGLNLYRYRSELMRLQKGRFDPASLKSDILRGRFMSVDSDNTARAIHDITYVDEHRNSGKEVKRSEVSEKLLSDAGMLYASLVFRW